MGRGWLSSAKPMGAALSGRAVVLLGTTQSLLVFAACLCVFCLYFNKHKARLGETPQPQLKATRTRNSTIPCLLLMS